MKGKVGVHLSVRFSRRWVAQVLQHGELVCIISSGYYPNREAAECAFSEWLKKQTINTTWSPV